ncbi:DUF7240 domain-containing protein [Mycobacterium yunnanensis]|uniref:DUF7240 domain-containing protein n=1 Tax=Mycobacterium yunnanensis TaxID=368477 RepID=UPI0021F3B52B|nr:hypothetical protein [Mycobacterium yunnanensis]
MPLWEPPPGYDDLLGDCDQNRGFTVMMVGGVGEVRMRRPGPDALGDLAMGNNPKATPEQRSYHSNRFVQQHLDDGELERILTGMVDGELPPDSVFRVGRVLATWGTARPYGAVVALAVLAGRHWRPVRALLLDKGVGNPMGLPSMHSILDVAEQAALDSFSSDEPQQDRLQRDEFTSSLYKPDQPDPVKGERPAVVVPEGFDDENSSASFDAFARAVR